MKYTMLFTGGDALSHFEEVDAGVESQQPLGSYSKTHPVKGMMFRDFNKGSSYDWHTAPRPQWIIYLSGQVEVEASDGDKRVFQPGDVLFANDLTGKGHITRTLTDGKSIVVTADDKETPHFRPS